jgi:hypothetical protein
MNQNELKPSFAAFMPPTNANMASKEQNALSSTLKGVQSC